MDYEPPDDIPARRFATREIGAWVLREYGLKAYPWQIAHIKRKHPGVMMDITKKWTGRCQDWSIIHAKLAVYFSDRMPG